MRSEDLSVLHSGMLLRNNKVETFDFFVNRGSYRILSLGGGGGGRA